MIVETCTQSSETQVETQVLGNNKKRKYLYSIYGRLKSDSKDIQIYCLNYTYLQCISLYILYYAIIFYVPTL